MNDKKLYLDAIFEEISNEFTTSIRKDVRITNIDHIALKTWSETWKHINIRKPPNGGWDWVYKRNYFRKYSTNRLFDMSIWSGNILCGLVLGKMSKGSGNISLYYIEGFPGENHPLKRHVLNIIMITVIECAKLLCKKKIKLIEPVDGLIATYKEYGFTCKTGNFFQPNFCEKIV